jgi:pSer/pThr/pTyr-binding forkhead associated (FHA) protein
VIAQGEQVKQIIYEINGQGIGAVEEPPFMIEWDLSNFDYGELSISAIAQGENFEELARDSVTIVHLPPVTKLPEKISSETPPISVVTPSPSPEVKETIGEVEGRTLTTILWILGPVVLAIIAGGYFVSRWKKQKESNLRYGPDGTLEIGEVDPLMVSEATFDEIATVEDSFGSLTVIYSDDPAMINQVFVVSKPKVTLGRSAENDFVFPKDNPVSRFHVVIELQNKQLVLYEVKTQDKTGNPRLPKYGTFIKSLHGGGERQVSTIPETLKPGDEIRLGNRTTLKFTASIQHVSDLDETLDEFDLRENDDLGTIEVKMD